MKLLSAIFLLLSVVSLCSCSSSRNYKDAVVQTHGGKTLIKLKGKRLLMAHDPVSALLQKTYEDSILITIPRLTDGVILGENIPVASGAYSYNGELIISGSKLIVNLFYDNTDYQNAVDKEKTPLAWNGQYTLLRN